MRKSKQVGHLSECAVELTQRIVIRVEGMTTSSIRSFTVWSDHNGFVFMSQSDSQLSAEAQRSMPLIGVYYMSVSRKYGFTDEQFDQIKGDIEEAAKQFKPRRAA